MFTQSNGRPLYPNSLTRWHLRTVLKKAELPIIRYHDLRGSAATLLYELGEDGWTIASICGHAAAQTAHEHYIHKQVKHQDGAMSKIDFLLKEKMRKTL